MKKRLKQLIQKGLASMGYAIVNLQADPQRATMQGAIEALANRRPTFQTVIDIGASDGRWARLLLPHTSHLATICWWMLRRFTA